MALADFFRRDAAAISQVLQGFQTDEFIKKLDSIEVAIAIGEQAADSRDGRALLDLTVRLAARLYPTLTFATVPASDELADELMALASAINPSIDVSRAGNPDVALAVGADAPAVEAATVFAGCDGWVGRVGTKGPYGTSDIGNPFGAGFAACLSAANLFRFLFLPDGSNTLDEDASFPGDAASFPSLTPTTLSHPLVLVGAGAVGNSAVWALAQAPIVGQIWLVDPETVEMSNLQRYVLCVRSDDEGTKVEIAGERLRGSLRSLQHRGTWASFAEANGYGWQRVLVALDSARDRRAVQATLPQWIANAWTQLGDLGVSTHSFLGPEACLACLYLPTQSSKSEDQIVAEGLKIPELQPRVRFLLGTGDGTDRELCDAIAAAWGLSTDALDPYVGKPLRELWAEGVCGGGIVRLEDAGPTPRELQVPLAFQSAFAGVLLAAETVRDVQNGGAQRKTQVRQLDVLRPLGDASPRPVLKAPDGNCICGDPDFVSAYEAKYGLASQSALPFGDD